MSGAPANGEGASEQVDVLQELSRRLLQTALEFGVIEEITERHQQIAETAFAATNDGSEPPHEELVHEQAFVEFATWFSAGALSTVQVLTEAGLIAPEQASGLIGDSNIEGAASTDGGLGVSQ